MGGGLDFKKDNKEKNRKKQEQLKKRKVERTSLGGADVPESTEKDPQDEPGSQHGVVKRSRPLDGGELAEDEEKVKEDDKDEDEEEEDEGVDEAMEEQEQELAENLEDNQDAEDDSKQEEG